MGCVHAVLDERKRHAYIVDVEAQPEETLFAHHDEYEIGSLIQTGGVGRVYRGVRKVDKRPVALKMFGYTPRIPTEAEVNKEIRHMMALGEVPGIIQCLGLFRDTAVGLVPGKLCTTQFPVIAMELVEGGDFLSRVLENRMVSEKVLSQLFKALVKTLSLIHEKGFVHRDVKLENLLFCKYETFSTIKVIDLGMMVQLSPKSSVHISDGIQGTPGYLAPESILCHEYSAATDMWQAGCCLYTMLSAEPAFIEDNLQQVTEGEFNKMKGFSWVGISEDAKDLVTSLLTKDKTLRISAEDVLKHPWIVSTSTGVNLEKEYYARIKALSLRRNLRGIYKVQNILQANKRRRTEFSERLRSQSIALKRETSSRRGSFSSQESQKVKLPRARSNSISSSPGSAQKSREMSTSSIPGLSIFTKPSFMSGDSDANLESLFVDIIFQHKLDTLRKYIVREACPKFLEDGGLFAANGSWLSRNADTALNFEKFVELVKAVDLTELAHMSIFNSFDLNPEGISYACVKTLVHDSYNIDFCINRDSKFRGRFTRATCNENAPEVPVTGPNTQSTHPQKYEKHENNATTHRFFCYCSCPNIFLSV